MRRLLPLLAFLALCAPAQGAVVSWGANGHGELGAGFKSASQDPVTVKLPCTAKQVTTGVAGNHALCADGRVFAWGGNALGNLGLGTHTTAVLTPVVNPKLVGVTQIADGGSHGLALKPDGTVLVYGSNLFGEAGDGTSAKGSEAAGLSVLTPRLVPGLSGVCAVDAGGPDDVALMCDGTVKAWGENRRRQLGAGPPELTTPRTVPGLTGVKQVAVGAFPAAGGVLLALLNDGTVRALGRNDQGQLGNGGTTDSSVPVLVQGLQGIVGVSADVDHSLALRSDGTVFSFGSNRFGELGVGAGPEGCGLFPCSRFPVPLGLHNVTAISAGFRYSVAVANGKPFSAGWNLRRTLGDGTELLRSFPVPVLEVSEATQVASGLYHSLVLTKGAGPAPVIEAIAGVGMVTVRWRDAGETRPFHLSLRPVTKPAGSWSVGTSIPASARSFTISGLLPVAYEIRLSGQNFGLRTVTATPG